MFDPTIFYFEPTIFVFFLVKKVGVWLIYKHGLFLGVYGTLFGTCKYEI